MVMDDDDDPQVILMLACSPELVNTVLTFMAYSPVGLFSRLTVFMVYTAQLIDGTVLVNLQSFLLPMLCSDRIPEEMRGLRLLSHTPIHGVHHGAL